MRGILQAIFYYRLILITFFFSNLLINPAFILAAEQTYQAPWNICANANPCESPYPPSDNRGRFLGRNCEDPGFLCGINPFCTKYTGTECCTGASGGDLRYDGCRQIMDNANVCQPATIPGIPPPTGFNYRTIECYRYTPTPICQSNLDCVDGNPCTEDICSPDKTACSHNNYPFGHICRADGTAQCDGFGTCVPLAGTPTPTSTPVPTLTVTPTPIGPPPAPILESFAGNSCYLPPYEAALNWSRTSLPSTDTGCPNGFWVDIDDNSSFSSYSNKCVTGTATSAPSGFGGPGGAFTFQKGITYYARVYNGDHSNTVTLTPNPVPSTDCGASCSLTKQSCSPVSSGTECIFNSTYTLNGTLQSSYSKNFYPDNGNLAVQADYPPNTLPITWTYQPGTYNAELNVPNGTNSAQCFTNVQIFTGIPPNCSVSLSPNPVKRISGGSYENTTIFWNTTDMLRSNVYYKKTTGTCSSTSCPPESSNWTWLTGANLDGSSSFNWNPNTSAPIEGGDRTIAVTDSTNTIQCTSNVKFDPPTTGPCTLDTSPPSPIESGTNINLTVFVPNLSTMPASKKSQWDLDADGIYETENFDLSNTTSFTTTINTTKTPKFRVVGSSCPSFSSCSVLAECSKTVTVYPVGSAPPPDGGGSTPPPGPTCGNRVCDLGERCTNCAQDCGACPVGEYPYLLGMSAQVFYDSKPQPAPYPNCTYQDQGHYGWVNPCVNNPYPNNSCWQQSTGCDTNTSGAYNSQVGAISSSCSVNNSQPCYYPDLPTAANNPAANVLVHEDCFAGGTCSGHVSGRTDANGIVSFLVPISCSAGDNIYDCTAIVLPDTNQGTGSFATCQYSETVTGTFNVGSYSNTTKTVLVSSGNSCSTKNGSVERGSDSYSGSAALVVKPPIPPWIQTTSGDVHSNTKINTPGGPP